MFLKERRKLILVPRKRLESDSRAQHVTLLERARSCCQQFHLFTAAQFQFDVVDTVVWRILDQIGLPSSRAYRWADQTSRRGPRKKP